MRYWEFVGDSEVFREIGEVEAKRVNTGKLGVFKKYWRTGEVVVGGGGILVNFNIFGEGLGNSGKF